MAQRALSGIVAALASSPRADRDASPTSAGSSRARRLEAALFRAVDGIGLIAHNLGYRASNRRPRAEIATPAAPPSRIASL